MNFYSTQLSSEEATAPNENLAVSSALSPQEELRLFQRRVAHLEAALQNVARAISHDVRAPLRHVQAYNGLVKESLEDQRLPQEVSQEMQSFTRTIEQSARRMGDMLEALQALVRLQCRQVRWQVIDAGECLRRAQADLPAEAQELHLGLPVHPMVLHGDMELLAQACTALLHNAWKFGGQTPVAQVQWFTDGRGWQVLEVRDAGVGFDGTRSHGLFQPFQRMHREGEFPGIGHGLAMVQIIAQLHGGEAQAKAEPGKGCTVTLRWPAQS